MLVITNVGFNAETGELEAVNGYYVREPPHAHASRGLLAYMNGVRLCARAKLRVQEQDEDKTRGGK